MNTQNYPSWLVPLEIARQLKEIGFNEPCLVENVETHSEDYNLIDFEEQIPFDTHAMLENIEFVKNQDLKDEFGIYKSFVLRTAIPTWEQVFEWFREKGLFHSICIVEDLIEEVKEFETEIRDNNADIICIIHRDTYEEAREALVKALIRTYKNEQP